MLRIRNLWSDRTGASLVEFTILLPFLLILGLGVSEFSSALYQHHLITTGLRDAARYLARVDDPDAKSAAAKELAVYGEIGGTTKRVPWWNVADVAVSLEAVANPVNPATGTRTYRGGDPIQIVRVSTTTSYPGVGFLRFLGFGSGISLSAFHEERVIHE